VADDLKANIVIKAIDRASSAMRTVTKNFETMRAAQKRANIAFRRAADLRQAGEGVSRFSRAMIGAVRGPIQEFEEFQATMSNVKAVMGGLTEKEFADLTERAKELGGTTRWTATQAAQAMKYFGMAGYDAEKTMAGVPITLDLATAAGTDLGRTADIVSDLMGSLGVSMSDLPEFANQLTRTFTGANVTLETLFESLIYSGAVAKQMKVSNQELLAMTGLLGSVGIKGSTAGTALRAMIAKLTAMRRQGQKTLQALNVGITDVAGNLRPLPDILSDVLISTAEMGTAKRGKAFAHIFGLDAMTAASSLATMGRDEIAKFTTEVASGTKTVQEVARVMDDNARGATIRLSSAIGGLNLTMADQLEPTLTSTKQELAGVIQSLTEFANAHPTTVKVIMMTVGALGVLSAGLTGLIFTMAAATTAMGVFAVAMGSQKTGAELMGAALKFLIVRIRALTVTIFKRAIPATTVWVWTVAKRLMPTFTGWATSLWTKVVPAVGGAAKTIWVKALPALAMYIKSAWAAAAASLAAVAPFLAIGAAIAGVSLAIVQLVKHWDELDFEEGMKGISEHLSEFGILSTLGELFDPRTLLKDMGVMGGTKPPVIAPTAEAAPATLGAAAQAQGRVDVGIKVDAEGRATASKIRETGPVRTDIDTGMLMATP
jgi:TP901 family phage tail tape measure protein